MRPLRALTLVFAVALGACGPHKHWVDASHERSDEAGPSDCTDDAREPDDTLADVLGKLLPGPVSWKDQVSCPGNDDLIHVWSDGQDPVGALVTWNAADGKLRVDLLDAKGRALRLDGETDLADRAAGKVELMQSSVGGDVYVRVRNETGTRIPYAVEVRTDSP